MEWKLDNFRILLFDNATEFQRHILNLRVVTLLIQDTSWISKVTTLKWNIRILPSFCGCHLSLTQILIFFYCLISSTLFTFNSESPVMKVSYILSFYVGLSVFFLYICIPFLFCLRHYKVDDQIEKVKDLQSPWCYLSWSKWYLQK